MKHGILLISLPKNYAHLKLTVNVSTVLQIHDRATHRKN